MSGICGDNDGAMNNCCDSQFCFQVCFFAFSSSRIGPTVVMA